MGVAILAGVVVAPYLVHRLDETRYALWILIASFTNYFGLLDMGVRGAMGRQVAFHRARNDQAGLSATMSTAMAMLGGAGTVAMAGMLAVTAFFSSFVDVPADQMHSVHIALLLVGVNLWLGLPLTTYDAVLWAYQRFDLINAVDIGLTVVRVALVFGLIGSGYGLVAMGVINLLTLAGAQAVKGLLVHRLRIAPRVGVRQVTRGAARALLGIGLWNVVIAMAAVVSRQAGVTIIGLKFSGFPIALVTPFSIAQRLMGYGHDFLVASTGVLTPVAIALHADEQEDQQKTLFLEGSKYCLALSLFFLSILIILGQSIITVWMGREFAWSYHLLLIMVLGEALPASQWMSFTIILGKYRHKRLGQAGMVEDLLAVGLALALVRPLGLVGVCLGFAVPGFLCRGVFQLVYASRLVKVPLRQYAREVAMPVLLAAAGPIVVLGMLARWRAPQGWLLLLAYLTVYGCLFMGCCTLGIWYEQTKAAGGQAMRAVGRRVAGVVQSVL
jgi:O-antigen/teichoic acid export membrane protein